MACSCPNFVLGRLKKKKKMEEIAVFSFLYITLVNQMYFRQFVSVIGSYTMVRYLKRLKSSRLGRVQAFPMYGGLGMSAPSRVYRLSDS